MDREDIFQAHEVVPAALRGSRAAFFTASQVCLASIAALHAAIATSFAILDPREIATRFAADDAFFYLVIAQNGVGGHVASFDAIHTTNGFHPLWALLLHPLAWIADGRAIAFLRISLVVSVAISAATHAIVFDIVRTHVHERAAWIAAAALAFLTLVPAWWLTEASIAMFVVAALFREVASCRPRRTLWVGILGGLALLARLDSLFVVGASIASMPRATWRARSAAAAIASAFLLPYLAVNLAVFGHLVPISGAIKGSFPEPHLTNLPLTPSRWIRLLVPIGIAVLVLARRRETPQSMREIARALHGWAAGTMAFALYELLFQSDAEWGLYAWHFAVPTVGAAIALGVLAPRIAMRLEIAAYAPAALIVVTGLVIAGKRIDRGLDDIYRTATWVNEHTRPDETLAATDAGILAFFGERRVVNLDGLMNDFAYQDVLRDRRLGTYLAQAGVDYVCVRAGADPLDHDDLRVFLPARLHGGEAGDTLVLPRDRRVYTSPHGSFGIWRTSE